VSGASGKLSAVTAELAQSVEMFLAAVMTDVGERRTTVRDKIHADICIVADGKSHQLKTCDLSLKGLRVSPNPGLPEGSSIAIEIAGSRHDGIVVWASPTEAGLRFRRPLAEIPPALLSQPAAA